MSKIVDYKEFCYRTVKDADLEDTFIIDLSTPPLNSPFINIKDTSNFNGVDPVISIEYFYGANISIGSTIPGGTVVFQAAGLPNGSIDIFGRYTFASGSVAVTPTRLGYVDIVNQEFTEEGDEVGQESIHSTYNCDKYYAGLDCNGVQFGDFEFIPGQGMRKLTLGAGDAIDCNPCTCCKPGEVIFEE